MSSNAYADTRIILKDGLGGCTANKFHMFAKDWVYMWNWGVQIEHKMLKPYWGLGISYSSGNQHMRRCKDWEIDLWLDFPRNNGHSRKG
jgi:hypothetical protein